MVGLLGSFGSARPSGAAAFDFTTGFMGTGFGNSIVVSDEGVTVTLTGFSLATTSGATFTSSQVRRWSTGVGSCNQGEGLNCANPHHTVDNDGRLDVLFISFSQPVALTSALITAWAADFDVSFWGGTGLTSLTGLNLSGLGLQYDSLFGGTATSGMTTRTVDLTVVGGNVTWLAFGAKTGHRDDRFKFRNLAVSVPKPPVPTPEPGVLLLLAASALGVVVARRR